MKNARAWGFTLVFVGMVVGCGSSGKSSDGSVSGSGGSSGPADGGTGGTGGAGGASSAGVSHCDITGNGLHECLEYEEDYTGSRPQGCAASSGTYATGACDSGSSGGCRRSLGSGGTETDYFYPPEVTVEDVMVTCQNYGNANYVAP